jgi:hypothetical protein
MESYTPLETSPSSIMHARPVLREISPAGDATLFVEVVDPGLVYVEQAQVVHVRQPELAVGDGLWHTTTRSSSTLSLLIRTN